MVTSLIHVADSPTSSPYRFWVSGAEGAGHVNGSYCPFDKATATGDVHLDRDYGSLPRLGLRTERVGVFEPRAAARFHAGDSYRRVGRAPRRADAW